jgi:hypothetical protein
MVPAEENFRELPLQASKLPGTFRFTGTVYRFALKML